MNDLIPSAEVRHMFAGKVGSIVRDNGMWKPEAINDVLPENFTIYCPVISRSITASIHLVKKLVATRRNLNWAELTRVDPPHQALIARRARGSAECEDFRSACWRRERTFDIVGTSSHIPWHHRTSWASSIPG